MLEIFSVVRIQRLLVLQRFALIVKLFMCLATVRSINKIGKILEMKLRELKRRRDKICIFDVRSVDRRFFLTKCPSKQIYLHVSRPNLIAKAI